MRLFLSYGHDSNEPLVQRIMHDLKNRGHDVWFDKNEIKTGDDWRREITEGITSSDKFVSFLSKHSTRDPGVCLDEIAIAIGVKGGNIQTILVESEGEVQPPASISHIQWLDMHDWKVRQESNDGSWDQWYGERLAEIVRVVESDESKRFSGEIETLSKMLCPVSSDSRISDLLRTKLVGREWLASEVELWRTQARHSRVLWISADPGVGKSVFAANLAHWLGKGTVIATEFCQWNSLDHRDVNQIVRNLAFQIACRLADYRKLLLTLPEIEAIRSKDSDSAFKYLLVDPLRLCVSGGRERYLILIDALDEAGSTDANPLAELLARNADGLPDWIGLVVTSRPESGIETPFQLLSISTVDAGSSQNLEDIRRFILTRLELQLKSRLNVDYLVERVVELSGGIFLYAQQFCEAAITGHIPLDSPDRFPKGLSGIFFNYMNRSFPNQEDYRLNVRQLLRLILAAFEPLPTTTLAAACEMNREVTEDRLRQLGSLFPVIRSSAEDTVRPFHRSIADWLTDPSRSGRFFVDTAAGHRALADYCKVQLALPSRAPAYAIRHAVAHFRHCGAIDEALHLCRNSKFTFLRQWLAGSGINLVETESRLSLSTSIAEEQFCAAAKWLVVLRWLRSQHDPIIGALSLLVQGISQTSVERSISDLSRISDPSLSIAIAFLASLRSNMLGQHLSCKSLLRWISLQSTLRDSLHVTPGIEVINAVFHLAPTDLEEQLLSLPMFDDRHHKLFSQSLAWQKSQSPLLRAGILKFLAEDIEFSVKDYRAVEFVVVRAIMVADAELCLAAIKWMAKCPRPASIESLPLQKLSSKVPQIVTEFLSELFKNSRLDGYPAVQADVCAMVLVNEEYDAEPDASRRLEDISHALGIDEERVKASLVRLAPIASVVWQMSPRDFLTWLIVRRKSFAPRSLGTDSEINSERVQLFRQFAFSATTILRWVSANAENFPDTRDAVAECIKAIRDICQIATTADSESAWDLLCQLTCDNAEQWLFHQGFVAVTKPTLSNPDKANEAVIRLVLSGSDEEHDNLTKAWIEQGNTCSLRLFLNADRVVAGIKEISETDFPSIDDDLSTSSRLALFKTVAELAGEEWSPRWTLGIGRQPYFYKPAAAVDAYAKRLRKRIVEVAETHGWYPCLLQLCRNLAFLSGDDKLEDSEIQRLVVPAVEAMEASLVVGCPNDSRHRPSLTAITFCDKLPEQFARTLSALELVDDGLIWHVSRELCGHRQSEQFRDSVSFFRSDLTRLVQDSPPRLQWFETRNTHQEILDRAIAPLSLLLDDNPTDTAVDWICDWRNRRDLSKFIGDRVSDSTIERIVDRVKEKGTEKLDLLSPLLKRRQWDLVNKLFTAMYAENCSTKNLVEGFDGRFNQEPSVTGKLRATEWREEFEALVGMKPNEGLNYGIPNLAKKTLSNGATECEITRDCRNAILLSGKWESHLSNLCNRQDVHQGELIRSLLVAAILSKNSALAEFAERLCQELPRLDAGGFDDLFLWAGLAVAPNLITQERITRVAENFADAIELLVLLGAWEAIEKHFLSTNKRAVNHYDHKDATLQWYRLCATLTVDAQLKCLEIYHRNIQQYVTSDNRDLLSAWQCDCPISETFEFDSESVTILQNCARQGRSDVAKEWLKALLLEAANGPGRRITLNRVGSICSSAGAFLALEANSEVKQRWIDYTRYWSEQLESRDPWYRLYRGMIMDGCAMQVAVDTPREIGPRLAFGEALAASGFDDLATEYFVGLAETTKSAWVAIRGFDALSKPELDQVQGSGRNASDLVRIAWELSKTGELRNDRGFLTQLSSAAMAVRAEDVLGEILSDAFIDSGDHRLLARVCLDEFCFHLRSGKEGKDTTVSRWKWQDAWRSPAIVQFTKVLISEQKDRAFVRTEVESCAREWRDAKMFDELGWLSVLVMRIDETELDLQVLTWLESILNELSTEVEPNWHVVKVLVEHFSQVPPALKSRIGILNFAFATVQASECEKLELLVDAASWLLVCEHKSAEVASIVETWLEQRPQSCHWVNRKLAVACSRQPSTQELANGYLDKLRYEDRVNVLDEISVCRNDSYLARLKTRLQFPLTTENLQKVHDLTRGFFLECVETEQWKSGDVAYLVKQLNPCGTDAEVHLAEMIGRRLSREQAVWLRDFAAEL